MTPATGCRRNAHRSTTGTAPPHLPARQIVADTFLAGTLHRGRQGWVFFDMTAGKAFPLSVDHYYYPSS